MNSEIFSEHEFYLKNKFEKLIAQAISKLDSGLKHSVKFSNDLRVISVDLITQSEKPFFMNIEITRELEKGINGLVDQQVLSDYSYQIAEKASTDANFLNRFGRLHKEGKPLDYYTASPFIFVVQKALHGNNLVNSEIKLSALKAAPQYRQVIYLNNTVKDSEKTIRFDKPNTTKEHELHQSQFYADDDDIPECESISTTEMPVFYENTLFMGVTLKLSKANGQKAVLHVPRCHIAGFEPLVSGYTVDANGNREGFVYYDWLIAEQGLLHRLRYGDLLNEKNLAQYVYSHLRFDVDVQIECHKKLFTLPTANYAPVNGVEFLAMLTNSNSNLEPVLIRVSPSGSIDVLNSRLKPVTLPENNHLNLDLIKTYLDGLFSSNRTYVFYLVNELRKTMGGANLGLAKQKNFIFLP